MSHNLGLDSHERIRCLRSFGADLFDIDLFVGLHVLSVGNCWLYCCYIVAKDLTVLVKRGNEKQNKAH